MCINNKFPNLFTNSHVKWAIAILNLISHKRNQKIVKSHKVGPGGFVRVWWIQKGQKEKVNLLPWAGRHIHRYIYFSADSYQHTASSLKFESFLYNVIPTLEHEGITEMTATRCYICYKNVELVCIFHQSKIRDLIPYESTNFKFEFWTNNSLELII